MISRFFNRLPGPLAVRVALSILIMVATVVLLGLFYEWLGSTFLDTGGQIG